MDVVVCPSCEARLRLPDGFSGNGKKIKCPKCANPIQVSPLVSSGNGQVSTHGNASPEKNQIQTQPPPRRRGKGPETPADEEPPSLKRRSPDDDDDDDEGPRARTRKRNTEDHDEDEPQGSRRMPEDEVDDPDEEEPRRRRRRSRREEDDDDQEDERSERPRRRSRENEEDDEDDENDDDDEEDKPRVRRRRSREDDEDDDYDSDRARKPIPKRTWRKIHSGIHFLYMGSCLGLGALVTFQVSLLLAMLFGLVIKSTGAALAIVIIGFIIGGLLGLANLILKFVGYGFCLNSPDRHSAKTLAIVTISLGGATLLCQFLGIAGEMFSILGNVLQVAEWIVFLFLGRALALNLKGHNLATTFRNLAIGYLAFFLLIPVVVVICVVIVGVGVAGTVQAGAGGNPNDMFGNFLGMFAALGITIFIFGTILFAGFLFLYSWFLSNLLLLRAKISSTLGQREGDGLAVWIPLFAANIFLVVIFGIAGVITVATLKTRAQDQLPANNNFNNNNPFQQPNNPFPRPNNPFQPPNNPFGKGAINQSNNYGKIQIGMTEGEVRNLLGDPSIIHANRGGPGTQVFQYPVGLITMQNGRVTKKFP